MHIKLQHISYLRSASLTTVHQVSNVVDVHWGGTNRVLDSFSPLLRSPTQNPHATLVALYLNAVQETSTMADKVTSMAEEMELVQKYLPINLQALQLNRNTNPDILMFITAREMFRDFDGIFKRYMVEHDFETITKAAGLTLKDKHTIIPKWPMHLGRKATQEEFDQLLRSAHDGSERYVEWKRVV